MITSTWHSATLPIESVQVVWPYGAKSISHQSMTNATELHGIWRQMTTAHQQLNSSTGAERLRLQQLINMLRIEYRHLTSTYR